MTAFGVVRTNFFVMKNMKAPKSPAIPGEITQAAKTWGTPLHPQ